MNPGPRNGAQRPSVPVPSTTHVPGWALATPRVGTQLGSAVGNSGLGASLRSTAWRPTIQMDLPELWREAWAELGAVAACLLSEAEYGCKEEGPHCSTAQHLCYSVRGRCWALTACPDLLTLLTHVPGLWCAPPWWSETAVSSLCSAFIPVLSLLL